jgi:YD repeat-containing protein
MGAAGGSGANPANFSYAYTLDSAGHRTSVTERTGRTVNYSYDNIYRLTSETVAGDPNSLNGTIGYTYDPVGNRTQQTSTLPGITSGGFAFDADDRLASDVHNAHASANPEKCNLYCYCTFVQMKSFAHRATFAYRADRVYPPKAGLPAAA